MESSLRFVVGSLAVWRLSFLFAREDGPWDIITRCRQLFGKGALGTLFGCVKCLSLWIAVPFAFFVVAGRWERLVCWLALSGVASVIDEWTKPPFEWKETADDEMLRRDETRAAH